MAQLTAQLTWISLLAACALVMQRHLSPASAEKLLRKWLATERVRWQYERVENNSGVPTETALTQLWQSAGLTINWEETCAATNLAPRIAMRRGGTAPGGMVWTSHDPRAVQPVSQLGGNFLVHGIRVAREDVERQLRLEGYAESVEPLTATDLLPPAEDETCLGWLGRAITRYPQKPGENGAAYHRRLRKLSGQAWSESHIKNSLNEHRRGSPTGDVSYTAKGD